VNIGKFRKCNKEFKEKVKALEYKPSDFIVSLSFFIGNIAFLYYLIESDLLLDFKPFTYLILLNGVLYFGFKNTMNAFALTDSYLVISNSWRVSYKKEIKISSIRKAYEQTGNYDDFIVFVMKNDETQSFSTRRLSKADKESLISEINRRVTK
jgi:hypothetical protein